MNLWEALKKPFVKDERPEDLKKASAEVDLHHNVLTLSDDPYGGALMVDDGSLSNSYSFFDTGNTQFDYQNSVIYKYRELASDTEVSNAVDIIVGEAAHTIDKEVFKLDIDEENDKIKEVITKEFENVLNVLNIRENIFNVARQMYIDGQLNIALIYDKSDIKSGIKSSFILDPINLYFDLSSRTWKYNLANETEHNLYVTQEEMKDEEYTESEMVHVDYGLYTKIRPNETQNSGVTNQEYIVNLGYLENAFKTANLLQTLENMLVPLRYSRSVSRRLFNVDVGDLPPKQAMESLNKIRAEFKYKKSYDPITGTIKNIKNTQPMVEDYWFANRSGGKGTTLETMDEKGALMDLEDIRHAARKLYQSLHVPSSRNPYSEDEPRFSFQDTEITQEEMSFYIFVSRIRIPITNLIKEILRRQLVSTGVFTDQEWKGYEKKIELSFTAESVFLSNMNTQMFMGQMENFVNIKESIGQVISLETAVEKTFGWGTEQLREELEKIEEEKINPIFKSFYDRPEDEEGGGQQW
jgi:hypothetical protein